MKNCITSDVYCRAKSAVVTNKNFKLETFTQLIQSEIFSILNDYADIKLADFKVEINVNDFGDYVFEISALARNLKKVSFPIENL